MLPIAENYNVFPSVVRSGENTAVTVMAAERAFIFSDGEEYTVRIIPVAEDETSYYEPTRHTLFSVIAKDGAVSFEYAFEGEGEQLIILERDDKKFCELKIYSLAEDLYSLIPLKGDLHAHSVRSDGARDPAALAGHYREQGYDFMSLTDHNRYYPGGEIDDAYSGVATSLIRIKGEEVHVPVSPVHVVHAGGSSSVTELYFLGRENYEREAAEYMERVPKAVPEKYKERYAKAMWATDKIHEAGGIAIFPHPFWMPGKSRIYNVCEELARILLMSGMFDAYELIGGMGQIGNNKSVALWSDLRAMGLNISVVGSSDVHKINNSQNFPHLFTVCFAKERSHEGIIDAVKAGLSVAVEASGDEYARRYRAYGSFRLVSYAQFLFEKYFAKLQRIAAGEGVAMRAYAMGDAPSEMVELYAKYAADFSDKFFGRKKQALPSENILAFEEKWREVHAKGPTTRGSAIDPPNPINI